MGRTPNAVHQHCLKTIWSRLDSEPETEYVDVISDLNQEMPPVALSDLIDRGLGTIVDPLLQKLRRKGYVRSVRKGVWKKEENATFDEVSANLDTRTRRGVHSVVNVAKEIHQKIKEMPGLRADVADDLEAWIALAEDEWFESDHRS